MKSLFFSLLFFGFFAANAQEEHEAFKKDAELKTAFMRLDLTAFMETPVNVICDTLDRTVNTPSSLNALMKTCVEFPKNSSVRKASETNNGYVQTFGIYNKAEDALMYVRFTLNPESGKLEEVMIEKND
ncbi:MAG: hypothetical protein WC760_06930 [Bacteroidia bacterium]|jgi:hypothetical protein